MLSIPPRPNTCRLASATYALPGPTMRSTGAIVAVPYAMAATAWAPPTRYTSATPARRAASSTSGFSTPPGAGTHIATRPTPATRAGTAFISTEDGYAALPPGTYRPTASSAVQRMPRVSPAGSGTSRSCGICARWNASIRVAASSSAAASAGSTAAAAASISAADTRMVSGAKSSRSSRAVSSISAASPRARTSAMMAATGASTRAVVSRAASSRAEKAAGKPGAAVSRRITRPPPPARRGSGRSTRQPPPAGSSARCG